MTIKILRVKYRAVWKQEAHLMVAVADFGHGQEIEIPIPAHFLPDDDPATIETESAKGMESLAEALLDFARRIRTK
jgi:hypothetical protein